MHKYPEVGPDLVNVFHLVALDDHFHTHLTPGRHTYDITDIPFFGVFDYLTQLLIPVFHGGDAAAGFIKRLEPEGSFFRKDAA